MTAKFSINPRSLIATIFLNEKNDRIINNLKIACSNLSDNYSYKNNTFLIPWFELRRGIVGIAYTLKQESVSVQFDDFTSELIQEVIDDKKSIKEKRTSYRIDKEFLIKTLTSSNFNRKLKIEQIRDALKLLDLKHGANFSVPGAGKTTTILAVHTVLKSMGIVSKLFVISPINAFISWEDEIREIFKDKAPIIKRLKADDLQDFSEINNANPDVILVNYEKLRRDINEIIPFFINNNVHLILDESHRVKSGVNNISYNQIIKLADLAKRRDILSGTPMPQNFNDLEPQFDYLWPGEKIIPDQTKTNEDIILKVNQAISGLYVRTTKNELGLDAPIIKYTTIPMGPIQAELYKLFRSELARTIAEVDKPTTQNFRRIGRSVVKLLQAATNPMLLTLKDDYEDETLPIPKEREYWELLEDFSQYEKPVKIEYLRERVRTILEESSKNKIIIWTYFVRNITILEKIFKDYNPVTIYGGIPTGNDADEAFREGRIKKFHIDETCRIMIANPQACGEGISLHKICHHAIYLDRNFNAAYYLQSIDRIHRLGLEKGIETNVEILITENSIDELLITRLNNKILAMGSVLNDTYLQSLAYDPADISLDDENGIDTLDFAAIKAHVEQQ